MSDAMHQLLYQIDHVVRRALLIVACVLLSTMVLFTTYTVFMRYVFLSPPFWGDTLTMFANTWLVLLAFALGVRDRSHISMQALYTVIPERASRGLEVIWTLAMLFIGLLLAWPGYEAATRVPGAYWELGNLPKRIPMLILPLTGGLVVLASALVLLEEVTGVRAPGAPDKEPVRNNPSPRTKN